MFLIYLNFMPNELSCEKKPHVCFVFHVVQQALAYIEYSIRRPGI